MTMQEHARLLSSTSRGAPERGDDRRGPGRTRRALGEAVVIAFGLLFLVGCSPLATVLTWREPAATAYGERLRRLSANPAIRRAAQYRLRPMPGDPAALPVAIGEASEPPESVRAVLATEIDGDVIVDWLVSFGAMGAWTAYDPRSAESVAIPVSEIPALVEGSPTGLSAYRLRDREHVMLVYPVVVESETVGAVGFVLTQTDADPLVVAKATPLGG